MTLVQRLISFATIGISISVSLAQTEPGRSSVLDSGGNIVSATISQTSATNFVTRTVKRAQNGTIVWAKDYSPMKYVAQTRTDSSGNVYVGGSNETTFYLIKYNSSGALQWSRTYLESGSFFARATGLALDSGQNPYLVGYSLTSTTGSKGRTIKWNPSGTLQWAGLHQPYFNTELGTIEIAPPRPGVGLGVDQIYVQGVAYSGATKVVELVRYNPDGTRSWSNLTSMTADTLERGTMALDGSYQPVVMVSRVITGVRNLTLMKTDPYGTPIFNVAPVTTGFLPVDLIVDSSGNIAACGNSPTTSSSGTPWQVAKFNGSTGAVIWNVAYALSNTYASALVQESSGNYLVVGTIYDPTTYNDVRVGRFDNATGTDIGFWEWNYSFNDHGSNVLPINSTDFIVTGDSDPSAKVAPLMIRYNGFTLIWSWIQIAPTP